MRRDAAVAGACFTILIGGLLVTDVAIAGASLHALLIAVIIIVLVVPAAYRAIKGKLSLFEPLVMADIALGVMFIGRPLADLAAGRTSHLGYDIMPTFDTTLGVLIIAVSAFQVGYHLPVARYWARRMRKPPRFKPQVTAMAGWLFFLFGGSLFAMFLAHSHGLGTLAVMLAGRAAGNNQVFLGATGYFYNGLLMWAASALIFFALATVRHRRVNYLWFAASAVPLLVYFTARGSRSQLLPLIVAVPTFWYLWNRRRPSIRTICVVAILGIVLMGFVRETRRSSPPAQQDTLTILADAAMSPIQQATDILNGADNEMFDSLTNELRVVPSKVGFSPGHSLLDFFIRAVPRALWPSKPLESNNIVVSTLWPVHYSQSRASAAFSIVGPFYFDSGIVGVTFGMLMIGILLGMAGRWYLLNRNSVTATLVYSMVLPFVVILMRGTLTGTVSRMLFMVVPLYLLVWLTRIHWGITDKRAINRGSLETSNGQ